MKRQGFTFRYPNGNIDYQLVDNVEAAQSNAAFASDRPYSYIELPHDWDRAYKQGFRIVSAKLVSGAGNAAWKSYRQPH